MATTSFVANVNKTVTVEGIIYSLTVPTIPDNLTVYLNEVELTAGETVTLTDNMSLTFAVEPQTSYLTTTYTNQNTVMLNDVAITSGQRVQLNAGENTLTATGATAIPAISVNGDGITNFTVNGIEYQPSQLPYTFTPAGGRTNSIYIQGADTTTKNIEIVGTNIDGVTINNEAVTLPYKGQVTEDIVLGVSGEIYQLDLTSKGGATIGINGQQISDGNSPVHQIIDISSDTYCTIDGTHAISITGTDIKSISVNGVQQKIENLPVTVNNNKMTATVEVTGFEPSEVHVTGSYIDTVTVDGVDVPVNENGNVGFEITTSEENHFINIIGSQPRSYGITWNDNGSTDIYLNGQQVESGTTSLINSDVYVSAEPDAIPVHFETAQDSQVQVNGKLQNTHDFTIEVSSATEIDVTTETCVLTIDYADNSYSILVPQDIITITAPHRDRWLFDCWSSDDVGIANPKSVRTTLNLVGKSSAHLVSHYEKLVTIDKPNIWN